MEAASLPCLFPSLVQGTPVPGKRKRRKGQLKKRVCILKFAK